MARNVRSAWAPLAGTGAPCANASPKSADEAYVVQHYCTSFVWSFGNCCLQLLFCGSGEAAQGKVARLCTGQHAASPGAVRGVVLADLKREGTDLDPVFSNAGDRRVLPWIR